VQIWNVLNGHTILEFPNPASSGTWQVSPDGQYFAFASWDNSVQVWNTITGRKVSVYRGHNAPLQVLVWSSDNQHIASASEDGTLQVWDAITGRGALTYHGFPYVLSLTWSPDSRLIAASSEGNTVQVLQAI
jgi:WD40 repeat protein